MSMNKPLVLSRTYIYGINRVKFFFFKGEPDYGDYLWHYVREQARYELCRYVERFDNCN